MTLTGKQKAAMLLMSLDVATATELLKGFDSHVVEELAVELSYLDAAGYRNSGESREVTREFFQGLQKKPDMEFKSFLEEMLKNTVGDERALQLQTQIDDLVRQRDPFLPIRMAAPDVLSSLLESEHPQAVAVVLSELPPRRSSEILGLLGEGIRLSAISRMTSVGGITRDAKHRVAELITTRLDALAGGEEGGAIVEAKPEQSLRRVAVILRNLEREIRDSVLVEIRQKDHDAADAISDLMVIWEDIPEIHDRSMQEGLRGLDESLLALALFKADEALETKIKSNISARAAAMVDEEASLMSAPKKKEIDAAKDKILYRLRELNRNGDLMWQEQSE